MIASTARVCDGLLFTVCMRAALTWLEQHRDAVNAMNVFPVPDGDTGTNMWHTLQSAVAAIQHLETRHIGQVSDALARGALRGARGNSGTILSMLLRGFANGLSDVEVMDAQAFLHACHAAVDYAYETVRAVMPPVEGTILTVAQMATHEIPEHADLDLYAVYALFVREARKALMMTPDLLPVLRQAGVVDSGGYGLVLILEGVLRFLDGEPLGQANLAELPAPTALIATDQQEEYGYDVQFLMIGENLALDQIRRDISAMGWSPLVDGDESLVKVHVHVKNPAVPLDYAVRMGVQLDDIVIENMQRQALAYQKRALPDAVALIEGVGVVTVAAGEGLRQIMLEYGAAEVISGGQTMNPSVADFVEAAQRARYRNVIFLPNNRNLILTAEQATALLPDRQVHVVQTKSVPQGMAALLAYLDSQEQPISEMLERMTEATRSVVTLEVTTASRDVEQSGIHRGEWLGLKNGTPVAHGADLATVTLDLLAAAEADQHELLTVFAGSELSAEQADALRAQMLQAYPRLTIEWLQGDQPLYPLLMSLE
ncbi:MAG: DAK2 domain-containing protein [Aggregatilineales bacterium]